MRSYARQETNSVGRRQEEAEQISAYDIEVTDEAERGLFSINKKNRGFIVDAIDDLAFDPRPPNSKLLVRAENLRRLTVGDYRVIYGVEESSRKITIELVRHRSTVYTLLGTLMTTVRAKGIWYSG